MRIPNSLLQVWEKYYSTGDVTKIAEMANCSRQTIYRAFRDEECNDDVLESIATYYREKKERIENMISDFQN